MTETNETTTEPTMPTLFYRLDKAVTDALRDENHIGHVGYGWMRVESIAAIERELIDDATRPLREEVGRLENAVATLKDGHTKQYLGYVRLKAKADALANAAVGIDDRLSDHCDDDDEPAREAFWDAFHAYAAEPREETPLQAIDDGSGGPTPMVSPEIADLIDQVTAAPSPDRDGEPGEADAITDRVLLLGRRIDEWSDNLADRLAALEALHAPDPNQDPAKQARPHRERIDDLVTRADVATERLDMQMRQIGELAHWQDNASTDLVSIWSDRAHIVAAVDAQAEWVKKADERLATIERRHVKLRKRQRHDHRWLRTLARDVTAINDWYDGLLTSLDTLGHRVEALEGIHIAPAKNGIAVGVSHVHIFTLFDEITSRVMQRLDALEALEAEREPGAVLMVTPEMVDAMCVALGWDRDTRFRGEALRALSAAMKAGGAK